MSHLGRWANCCWREPAATAEVWYDGWWHTGDLACCDAEGYCFLVGRTKDLFISGGEHVSPAEVEEVILTHPGVLEVAVIPRLDPLWGEVGLAIVVPRVPGSLIAEEIPCAL